MNMAFSPCLNRTEWKTLYRAAILETDQSLLSQRVSEAEDASLNADEKFSTITAPPRKRRLRGRAVCLAGIPKCLAACPKLHSVVIGLSRSVLETTGISPAGQKDPRPRLDLVGINRLTTDLTLQLTDLGKRYTTTSLVRPVSSARPFNKMQAALPAWSTRTFARTPGRRSVIFSGMGW
jgi:hypothetical protein